MEELLDVQQGNGLERAGVPVQDPGENRCSEANGEAAPADAQNSAVEGQVDEILHETPPVEVDDPIRRHFEGLREEARALRRQIPDFDLARELNNPVFLRLTAPGMGVSLEDAYFAVHRKQLQQAAMEAGARQTVQQMSNAIRSGSHRPQENGTGGHAPAVTAFDYRTASAAQRESLKKAIRAAAARGEKMYPGM